MSIEEELKTYLQVPWRYRRMIVACAIIAAVVALGISFLITPLYSATATVRVASAPGGASDYTYISSATRLSNTYVEIATSDSSLDKVAEKLGLQYQPKVQIDVIPETELIQITASDPDPTLAREIANTLAGLMVDQSMELYGGNAPTARQILEGQLQQAKADLDAAVSEYDRALRASDSQSGTVRPESGTATPSPNVETLARIVSVRQQIYGDLLQRYETARTNEQLRANAITIVEPASFPKSPATPRIRLNAALGLLAGLAAGVILAFLFEGMDDTLRGIEDVQAITALPILCTVPELTRRRGAKSRLSTTGNVHLSPAPAFDQLRARLILSSGKLKSTTFLITSPGPGVGKSTVAANLAISLAEGGNRVILVDMDFYHPCLHSLLGLSNEKGLSNYVRGEIELDMAVQDSAYAGLRVVTAGSSLDKASEWLTLVKIGGLLKTLGRECNYVLIDAPALLGVADPVVLASQVDAVLLVVARRKTERQHLRFTLQELSELKSKVAGIVVNRVADSQLYRYYAEQPWKQIPLQQEKSTGLVDVDAHGRHAGEDEEQGDAVQQS